MEEQHTDATIQLPRRVPDAQYWIIKKGFTHAEVFTIARRGGEAVLPVFSSKEEAQVFSGGDLMQGCWYAKLAGVGELISVLYVSSKKVWHVALDPAWEILNERALALVSVSREAFVISLLCGNHSRFEEWFVATRLSGPYEWKETTSKTR